MIPFRYGHASGVDWSEIAQACFNQLQPVPAGSNLGFLYLTDTLAKDADAALGFFRRHTGVAHWVGAVGVGICASGKEYYDDRAMAVLVAGLPEGSFRVVSTITSDFAQFEKDHGEWCRHARPFMAIAHGDAANGAISALVQQLARRLEGGYLVGGLSSSRGADLQIADGVNQGGLSGVLLRSDVAVTTRLTQGCSPIGLRHEITACEGNIIMELNRRPALDVFKADIGQVLSRDLTKVAGYIFAGLPIRGSDTGDYLVRNLVGIDPVNKMLAIGDAVETGDGILFCRRDADTAREDMVRMISEIKSNLPGPPRGGVYYSCLGRGLNLFGPGSAELGIIERELGSFPLVGFYANGEISHDRLYGYTGILTLFA